VNPCGFNAIITGLGMPFLGTMVFSDDLKSIYGVYDETEYNIPVLLRQSEIMVKFKVHKFDDGSCFIYESEAREFVSYIVQLVMNRPEMFESIFELFNLPSEFATKLFEFNEASSKLSELVQGAESFINYIKENSYKIGMLSLAGISVYIFFRAYLSKDFEPLHRLCALLPLALSFVPAEIKDFFRLFLNLRLLKRKDRMRFLGNLLFLCF